MRCRNSRDKAFAFSMCILWRSKTGPKPKTVIQIPYGVLKKQHRDGLPWEFRGDNFKDWALLVPVVGGTVPPTPQKIYPHPKL